MNPYNILGVDRSATKDEIKKAYRKLALQHHPDRGGDENKFKEITQAHTILTDDERRRRYDLTGGVEDTPQHPPFNPFDLFGGMFRNPEQQTQQLPPKIVVVEIELEEAWKGTTIQLNVSVEKRCGCTLNCDKCKGTGQMTIVQSLGPFQHVAQVRCDKCIGTGVFANGCSTCRNTGSLGALRQSHQLCVNVPPRTYSEFQQVFKELGSQPKRTNELPGDLIIQVRSKSHSLFSRQEHHLVYTCSLSLIESLITADRVIPLFDQDIILPLRSWIPLDPRKEYRLKGLGMNNDKGHTGDLIIRFNIQYENWTPSQFEALQEVFI
jgi:DnaJ-class molecular chaperone